MIDGFDYCGSYRILVRSFQFVSAIFLKKGQKITSSEFSKNPPDFFILDRAIGTSFTYPGGRAAKA